MRTSRGPLLAALASALGAVLAAVPAAAITAGQVDTFENEALSGWGGRASPSIVTSGGPAGDGDAYLRVKATNFSLGADNSQQWSGDYIAAGVTSITADLNNFSTVPLAIRITLFGFGGTFTTTNEIVLPPSSGWV